MTIAKYLIVASVLLITHFSSAQTVAAIVEMKNYPNNSWLEPSDDHGVITIVGSVIKGFVGSKIKLKTNFEELPISYDSKGDFKVNITRNFVKKATSFKVFISSDKSKEIQVLEYYCCSVSKDGSFASLKKNIASTISINKPDSELKGLKLLIPASAIGSDQNAIVVSNYALNIPYKNYFAVGPIFDFVTSGIIQANGIKIKLPVKNDVPRTLNGRPTDQITFFERFGFEWKTVEFKNVIVLASINGANWTEIQPDSVEADGVWVTLSKDAFQTFVPVVRHQK